MITLKQAKGLQYGQVLYHKTARNVDGSPARWRVNGAVKVWKRSPDKVRVPLKYGLYGFDYLDENTLHLLCLTEEDALK